ncbi:MAG: hypothetical protein C0412_21520 [Flavobacterium sp.]|nr:hypothetical protein [Flavobacterium sp.]
MNWIYKAVLQGILSIIPFGERINYQLQRIKGSHNISRVDEAVKQGVKMIQLLLDSGFQGINGSKILEVGTGWQPALPILFSFLGAEKIYTYDHVRHLRPELAKDVLSQVRKNFPLISKSLGISMDELKARNEKIITSQDLTTLLKSLNVEYIVPGNAARTGLPDNTLDLFFSHAVLEHIPEQTVIDITKEALRTLKPGFLYYNYIGLHDHYVSFDKAISQVNFLKYPEFIWKILAKNKITYLNRLRNSHFITMIKGCGFEILKVNAHIDKTALEMVKTMKLAKRFRSLEPEDLATVLTEIVACKPNN